MAQSMDTSSRFGGQADSVKVPAGRVLAPEEGKRIQVPGGSIVLKTVGTGAPGDHDVIEIMIEPGSSGPHPHVHRKFEHLFYVLEGEFAFLVGDEQYMRLGPGSLIHVPPGTVHDFRNSGSVPARQLHVSSPSGHYRYFEDMGALVSEGKFSEEALTKLRLKYDTDEVDVSWGE
jgi:mannose-6-phosphate isomerase-like protein (cupin superfamily)